MIADEGEDRTPPRFCGIAGTKAVVEESHVAVAINNAMTADRWNEEMIIVRKKLFAVVEV